MKRKQPSKVGWYDESRKVRRGLPRKTLEAFDREIRKVVACHFEKDEDGDYPVRVDVADRTYYERNDFEPLIANGVLADLEDDHGIRDLLVQQLRTVSSNQSVLADQLRRVFHQLKDRVIRDSRWGCGCYCEARPSHDDVMQVRLFTCERHDQRFEMIRRPNRSKV